MFFRSFVMMLLVAGAVMWAAPARAIEHPVLSPAMIAGIVGEQADGFLGLVSETADAQVRAALADVNEKRRQAYVRAAAANGQPVEVFARLTAEKQINNLPAGQFYRDPAGNWIRK